MGPSSCGRAPVPLAGDEVAARAEQSYSPPPTHVVPTAPTSTTRASVRAGPCLELGCDLAQGYHIARPMALADLADWFAGLQS